MVHPTSSVEHTLGLSKAQRTEAASERVRVYVHNKQAAALVVATRWPATKVSRHDVIVKLTVEPSGCFSIEAAGQSTSAGAAVVSAGQRHRVVNEGVPVACLAVNLMHPHFTALRAMFQRPVTALDRATFGHLNEQIVRAHRGQFDAEECSRLMDSIIDLLLAGAPATRPLDPRILHVLHRINADTAFPVSQLAAQVQLSPSRLSHLFAEQMGLSMRCCQARRRTAWAWRLVLWRPDLSFTEIAHLTKFSDSSHLARAFKSAYGFPASVFRNDQLLQVISQPVKLAPKR